MLVSLLLKIRREEEDKERVFITFFPVVVVVVDLIIVILFLVCRVAQKQLLKDAILIIFLCHTNKVVFYSRFWSLKKS